MMRVALIRDGLQWPMHDAEAAPIRLPLRFAEATEAALVVAVPQSECAWCPFPPYGARLRYEPDECDLSGGADRSPRYASAGALP